MERGIVWSDVIANELRGYANIQTLAKILADMRMLITDDRRAQRRNPSRNERRDAQILR